MTSPGILNVADPTLGYVFTPGPQAARYTYSKIDPDLEMPYTDEWSVSYERQMPFDSAIRISYTGNHVTGKLRYNLDNLPLSPLDGPVIVVDHPNNAPTGSYPDLRGKVHHRDREGRAVRRDGVSAGVAATTACPAPVPIADNEISQRVPRTNERRPDPRYGTNLTVSNGAESWYDGLQVEWAKRFSKGISFTATYTRSASGRHHLGGDVRRAPATRTSSARTRSTRGASRGSTRRTGSR